MPPKPPALDLADPGDRELAGRVCELLPDGVITVFGDGTIEHANRRAGQICGTRPEDLDGQPVTKALPLQGLNGCDWWAVSEPSRSLRTTTGHREKTLILPNGRVVLVTARYLRHPDGSLFAILLGLRDAAERMRAERALADNVTMVAHELRSPVASITGFTATLLRQWERVDDASKQVMLHTIQDDAERVTRLVNELLDIARIDARSLPIRPRQVDVAALLAAQVSRRVAMGEDADRFVVEIEDDLTELWADPDRLEQVVTNLVDNAVRHGAGQVGLRAGLATLDGGAKVVRLCVVDEGDGIPEQDRELVFSRFWQGGAKAGTGLGLFIVRGIVEAHGGTVRVGDRPGGGALFEAFLPAAEPGGGAAPLA